MKQLSKCKVLFFIVLSFTVFLSGCGGGGGDGGGSGSPSSVASLSSSSVISASSVVSSSQASSSSSSELTNSQRGDAATQTALNNAACVNVQPFYWEIGDHVGALTSGSVGGNTYAADTVMSIASASKWIFGAYLVQLRNGVLSEEDIASLTMSSGYTNFDELSCVRLLPDVQSAETVNECFQSANSSGGHNNDFNSAAVGKFYYNGGHFQKTAVDVGLGDANNAQLKTSMQAQLGTDFVFNFGPPQLAGGVSTSAANYAIFLRKILNNQLYIHDLLGAHAVCTNPLTCATALYTPAPSSESWNYSLAHWVEADPVNGDGSFSSAGAFGFYPWIDANKTYYGIVARKDSFGSGFESVGCGRLIRKAWMTGIVP